MKRVILSLAVATLSFGLAGCANYGEFGLGMHTQASAVMAGNNYRVVQTAVQASDSGFKVFGLGGDPKYSTVFDKIRAQAQLDGRPRALVNVTEDDEFFTLGFIVSSRTITITCDVIEFTGPPGG